MGIDEIKRWHWVVIGLLVGLGLGFMWSGQEPDTDGQLMNQTDFERLITMKYAKTGDPFVKNIVLEPITTDYRNKTVQIVRFKWLKGVGQKSGNVFYSPATYIAQIPYQPERNAPRPAKANLTLAEYLTDVAKRNPDLSFHYGWYNERPAAIAICTLGAVVLIGGIWPTLVQMMVGGGIAPKKKEKKAKQKKEDYFDRFSHEPEADTAGVRAGASDADRQRLEDMNEALEREVGSMASANSTDAAPAQTPAEVRKLEGGALEASAVPKSPGEDDDIEIKGEFYPVLIHHKKPHEEDDAANQSSETPKP